MAEEVRFFGGPDDRPVPRRPARGADMRRHHLALVMAEVAAAGRITRAELSRATRLTKGTVAILVDELSELGLLVEVEAEHDRRVGRPPTGLLALDGDSHCGVGLEINVDYIAVCVSDLLNRVRFHELALGDNRGGDPRRTLSRAAGLARKAIRRATAAGLRPAAVALALPAIVDTDAGRLVLAPNLGWSDVPVIDELRRRLASVDLPVMIENEANLAALGELWLGVGPSSGDFVHVSGEIGIGGGIVVGASLFRGAHGFAGEIGHVVVDPGGPPCSCGRRGCLERVAGQEALLQAVGLSADPATRLGGGRSALGALVDLLEAREPRALKALEGAGEALGAALATVVNVLDPDTVILGGIYAPLAPWLIGPLSDTLGDEVIVGERRAVQCRASALGPDAAVRGAAAWITQQLVAAPNAPLTAR